MANILITGSNGFIGKNLSLALKQRDKFNVIQISRNIELSQFKKLTKEADFVIHLAGANREKNEGKFHQDNTDFTKKLCFNLEESLKKPIIIYASSIKVIDNTIYSRTKLECENLLKDLSNKNGNQVIILRLPNVFGKWARPNYNSVVATFCHSVARNEKLLINNPDQTLKLLYIDDLIKYLLVLLDAKNKAKRDKILLVKTFKTNSINMGKLAKIIQSFPEKRLSLSVENLSSNLEKYLYATFLTYLPHEKFTYQIKNHQDERGSFSELFKSQSFGQISVFTIKSNMKRGGHFHDTKVEKFFVAQGNARFLFKRCFDQFKWQKDINSKEMLIIESIPGWWHEIENIGQEEVIIIVWANEIFDHNVSDTYR